MVTIGSARIDENGNIIGGMAGDQTGREVCTEAYYVHKLGWVMLRPKDSKMAIRLAKAMMDACSNKNIGYDQGQRESIVPMFKKYRGLGMIHEPCETDCSKLVEVCVWQATGKDPGWFTTGNAVDVLSKTGYFEKPVNVNSYTKLKMGDILCTKTKGHIVIVTSDDFEVVVEKEKSDKAKPAVYMVTTALNIRKGAGITNAVLGVLTKGTEVKATGDTENISGTKWFKVKTPTGTTGWVSGKYLKKKK